MKCDNNSLSFDQIWANLQTMNSLRQIQWQLTNAANWKPFWPARQVNSGLDLVSAQPEEFTYEEVPFGLKQEMEIFLKNAIVGRIMDERAQYITRWNTECHRRLYALLGSMEHNPLNALDLQRYHERELRDLLGIYEVLFESVFFSAKSQFLRIFSTFFWKNSKIFVKI